MRFLGFSRRKLNSGSDLEAVWEVIVRHFGSKDFCFDIEVGADPGGEPRPFDLHWGTSKLQEDGVVGFFRRNVVGIGIDNQVHNQAYFVYPHSTLEVETMESEIAHDWGGDEWLGLSEELLEGLDLDLALVLGTRETTPGYNTPLSIGIGLPKVFWIMCFGEGYSRLIPSQGSESAFFKREEFGSKKRKAFLSAANYENYLSAPPEVARAQRKEVGEELFHTCPIEKRTGRGATASWILSPRNLFSFASAVFRERVRDWRRYQAKVVPPHYRMKRER